MIDIDDHCTCNDDFIDNCPRHAKGNTSPSEYERLFESLSDDVFTIILGKVEE